MKRALSLLLALAMVFALAACGSTTDPNAGGSNPGNVTPGVSGGDGTNPDGTRPNRLIFGTTTQMSGDIGIVAWYSNNACDAMIRDLIHDYATVSMARDGTYVQNTTVCESIDITVNPDGTKTYTEKIKQGLKWNNGEPITAADFAAYFLVYDSPVNVELGGYAYPDDVIGGVDYQSGGVVDDYGEVILDEEGNIAQPVNYIAGIRLLDEYTISYTVTEDYANYYHELLYGSLTPLYLPNYSSANLTVKDDGNGVYLDGGELVKEEVNAARFNYNRPVTAGPYILTSLDMASYSAVLERNPYYDGNFEGQKPSIEQIVVKYTTASTQFDDLKTGGVDFLDKLAEGIYINEALNLVDAGGYDYVTFVRSGYGMIQFMCDGGPTQFVAVRQAIAYLLDRNEFANTFTGGYGSVVDGPYGDAQWMYQESKELFATSLNHYNYNPSAAVQLLVDDGWVLNADGTPYSGSGLRYKEVTPEQAGDYDQNVTLADGRILMPLYIKWASSEENSVSDLLATMLAEGQQVADAGMVIKQDVMSFDELLNYNYRLDYLDVRYGGYTYGMFNMGSTIYPYYDYAHYFERDPNSPYSLAGWNQNHLFGEDKLDEISVNMMYGITPGNRDQYLDYFQQFVTEWNRLLPDIPLYSNDYHTVYRDWLKGYDSDDFWTFQYAILYATIENAA